MQTKPRAIRMAHLLDHATSKYCRSFPQQLAASVLINLAWIAAVFTSCWFTWTQLLPVLRKSGQNDIWTGLYTYVWVAVFWFVLWLLRRVCLLMIAGANGTGPRIGAALTAGLAEICADLVLYFGLYLILGYNSLIRIVQRKPSFRALAMFALCAAIVFLWLTVKAFVIPLAMHEKRFFFPALFRAIRLAVTRRLFPKLIAAQLLILTCGALMFITGYTIASQCLGLPSFFNGIPPVVMTYLAPLWYVFCGYLFTIPFQPVFNLLCAACADTAARADMELPERAGLGSRTVSFFIDFVLTAIVLLGLVLAVLLPLADGQLGQITSRFTGAAFWVVMAALLICANLLCAVSEALFGGKTPGKKMMGLRTVSANSAPPSFAQVYLRALLRLVDILGLGAIMIFGGKSKTRLGDIIAKTHVVYD